MTQVLKVAIWVLVIAVAVVVLFLWVFPWVEGLQQDPTIAGSDVGALQAARSPR